MCNYAREYKLHFCGNSKIDTIKVCTYVNELLNDGILVGMFLTYQITNFGVILRPNMKF